MDKQSYPALSKEAKRRLKEDPSFAKVIQSGVSILPPKKSNKKDFGVNIPTIAITPIISAIRATKDLAIVEKVALNMLEKYGGGGYDIPVSQYLKESSPKCLNNFSEAPEMVLNGLSQG